MAKIGILTFHRSYNYGAYMQCYALSKRLQVDFPDHEVEVIDYATERVYQNYPTTIDKFIFGSKNRPNSIGTVIKNCGKMILDPQLLKRIRVLYRGFDEDIKFLPLSAERYVTDDYEAFFSAISDKYDIIVAGSDVIWEFKKYPFPNAYFLNGAIGNIKLMSYAASSDRMHYSELSSETMSYLKESFARFSYLGVRDRATELLLSHISDELCFCHNCDPTIFLNLSTLPKGLDRVKAELNCNGIDLSKPIIGLMGGNKLCKLVRHMFGKKYQIVTVYYYSKYADYYLNDLTPIEWAQISSLFSVTVTSLFHGSLLSLKNGTPTIATDYWHKVDSDHITKIEDLYMRLGLQEHYFYMPECNSEDMLDQIKNKIEYYIEHPDVEKINSAIEKESLSYNSFYEALKKLLSN